MIKWLYKMKVKILVTKRGNKKLLMDGFEYYLDRKSKNIFCWLCSFRKKLKSKNKLTTFYEDGLHKIICSTGDHLHKPATKYNDEKTSDKKKLPLLLLMKKKKVDNKPEIKFFFINKVASVYSTNLLSDS